MSATKPAAERRKRTYTRAAPVFVPTEANRASVQAIVGTGGTTEEVAAYLGIGERTVRKHFRDELDTGRLRVKASLRVRGVKAALSGDKSLLIFYSKVLLGMKEVTAHEHSGPNAGPIATEARVKVQLPDLSAMSEEDLARLYREMVEPVPPAA